jgi:hypothetical protein
MPVTIYLATISQEQDMSKKVTLIAAAGIVTALLAAPVFAQTSPAPSTAPQGQSSPGKGEHKGEEFAQRKQEMLAKIAEHIADVQHRLAEMQQRQSCVQAAADMGAMKSCFPDHGQGGGQGGEGGSHPQPAFKK